MAGRIRYMMMVLVLVVAGCGGGDSADGASDTVRDGGSGGESGTTDGGTSSQTDNAGGNQDGYVTVEGTTYPFTYDNLGRCGAEGNDGMIVSVGNLLEDTTRQVTLTYGLPEETASGEPIMQVVVMGEGGATQLYYSAVGFGSTDVGSVDSIERDGNTVRITGQLQRTADQTLVDFEAEATCDQ